MKLEIVCDSRDSAILIGDEEHNDIAEFFHSDHATVGQSYETALDLAKTLVSIPGWLEIRNELDRTRVDRDYWKDMAERWKAQFDGAAAAASEYSEFWEQHSGEFDSFGNYIPYSQIDGDLRAAKAEIERLRSGIDSSKPVRDALAWMEERARNSTSFGSHCHAYEVAARHLKLALDGDDVLGAVGTGKDPL